MSQVPDNPDISGVRAAIRDRDPAALGAIVASQLAAYRCSTVYGPKEAVLREVIEKHALPRLEQMLDVRRVVISEWSEGGPTLAGLVGEVLRQLDLAPVPGVDLGTLAAVRQAIDRAYRVSDRPLVIVLYGLEQLLDDDRDRVADQRLIDALAALVELQVHGLQLVMAVRESDLGCFRHLLRGRWRLLANDLRLHANNRRMVVIPLPIGLAGSTTVVAAGAATATAAPLVTAIVGGALAVTGVVTAAVGSSSLNEARALRERRECPPAITAPACIECPVCPEPATTPPSDPPPVPVPDDPPPVDMLPDGGKVVKPAMCLARPNDGPCATCVRGSCCNQLAACPHAAWRRCILDGKVPSDTCEPEAIEQDCRALALCAFEYECNATCFNTK